MKTITGNYKYKYELNLKVIPKNIIDILIKNYNINIGDFYD